MRSPTTWDGRSGGCGTWGYDGGCPGSARGDRVLEANYRVAHDVADAVLEAVSRLLATDPSSHVVLAWLPHLLSAVDPPLAGPVVKGLGRG